MVHAFLTLFGSKERFSPNFCPTSAKKTQASDVPSLRPDTRDVVAASRASCAC